VEAKARAAILKDDSSRDVLKRRREHSRESASALPHRPVVLAAAMLSSRGRVRLSPPSRARLLAVPLRRVRVRQRTADHDEVGGGQRPAVGAVHAGDA